MKRLIHLITVNNVEFSHELTDRLHDTLATYDLGKGDMATAKQLLVDLRDEAIKSWPEYAKADRACVPSGYMRTKQSSSYIISF